MKIKKSFQVKGLKFEIELEKDVMGKLIVPLYAKIPPENKIQNLFMSVDESNFDEDLKSLTPDNLEGNWVTSCYLQLQKLVVSHFIKFGRVLPADLEAYCAESLQVVISIGDRLSRPLDLNEKRFLFKKMLIETSDELKIPVNIPV
jgi:hypothetical protein